jgi:gas vesicle protein
MEVRATTTVETGSSGASSSAAAREAAQEVREDAGRQARQVADTAKQQTRTALADMGETIRSQVVDQKGRAAESLRALSEEMSSMASQRDDRFAGLMSDASSRVGSLSGWLDQHEPQEVISSVEEFARRRPVVFLAGAALAGVVTGRLTRGLMSGGTNGSSAPTATAYPAPLPPTYPAAPEPVAVVTGTAVVDPPLGAPVPGSPVVDPVERPGREL